MIEVIQAGQAGKTKLMVEMYRLRAKIFKDRMGWDVHVDMNGLEIDDFDTDDAIYLLHVNDQGHVTGNWRIIPTNHLTMIEKVWPHYLDDIKMTKSPLSWEMSRFAVDKDDSQSLKEGIHSFNKVTAEMFCGLTDLCIYLGIEEIYTLYNKQIGKLLRRLDCNPIKVSQAHSINGEDSFVGRFIPDRRMLAKLKAATGTTSSLINFDDLPPCLDQYLNLQNEKQGKAQLYVA